MEHITDSLIEQQKKGDQNLSIKLPSILLRSDDNSMIIIEFLNVLTLISKRISRTKSKANYTQAK